MGAAIASSTVTTVPIALPATVTALPPHRPRDRNRDPGNTDKTLVAQRLEQGRGGLTIPSVRVAATFLGWDSSEWLKREGKRPTVPDTLPTLREDGW